MHQIHRIDSAAAPSRGSGSYAVRADSSIRACKELPTARFPELQGALKSYYIGDVCSRYDECVQYYDRKVRLRRS